MIRTGPLFKDSATVELIASAGCPFEFRCPVVGFVSKAVVYLREIGGVWNERLSNQAVGVVGFFPGFDDPVARCFAEGRFQQLAAPADETFALLNYSVDGSDAPRRTNFVAWNVWSWSPFFIHRYC